MSNWYDDNAKGGYIYGPLEVPKEPVRKVKPLEYTSGRNPTLEQVIINLMDVYGLPEPVLNHPDTFDFPFAAEEKLHQLTAELIELRGIITRVSMVTDGAEAYPIKEVDYRRMDELVKRWEKEKASD